MIKELSTTVNSTETAEDIEGLKRRFYARERFPHLSDDEYVRMTNLPEPADRAFLLIDKAMSMYEQGGFSYVSMLHAIRTAEQATDPRLVGDARKDLVWERFLAARTSPSSPTLYELKDFMLGLDPEQLSQIHEGPPHVPVEESEKDQLQREIEEGEAERVRLLKEIEELEVATALDVTRTRLETERETQAAAQREYDNRGMIPDSELPLRRAMLSGIEKGRRGLAMIRARKEAILTEARKTEHGRRLLDAKDKIQNMLPQSKRMAFLGLATGGALLFVPDPPAAIATFLFANRLVPATVMGITAAATIGKTATRRAIAGFTAFGVTLVGVSKLAEWLEISESSIERPKISTGDTELVKTMPENTGLRQDLKTDKLEVRSGSTTIERTPLSTKEVLEPSTLSHLTSRVHIPEGSLSTEGIISEHFFSAGALDGFSGVEQRQFVHAFEKTINSDARFGQLFAGVNGRNALDRISQDFLNFDVFKDEEFRSRFRDMIIKNKYTFLSKKWGDASGIDAALAAIGGRYN